VRKGGEKRGKERRRKGGRERKRGGKREREEEGGGDSMQRWFTLSCLGPLPLLIISVVVLQFCLPFFILVCMVDRVVVNDGTEFNIFCLEMRNSIFFG
jgi:hypothetical protein